MQQTIEYDPETGRYVFKQTVGQGLLFRNPTAMELEDYLNFKKNIVTAHSKPSSIIVDFMENETKTLVRT